jgi:hypothetical protein
MLLTKISRFASLKQTLSRPTNNTITKTSLFNNTNKIISQRTVFVPLNKDICVNYKEDKYNSDNRNNEVTVYIKGFLAKGESPERFDDWLRCHKELSTSSHQWGQLAHGYHWNSGNIWENHLPYGTLVNSVYHLITKRKVPLSPQSFVAMATTEAVVMGGKLWYEFHKARENAQQHAPLLAQHLLAISQEFPRVRVVAHSLGCMLLIESLKRLPPVSRPNEIHLLAPALSESDDLHDISKEGAYVYFCDRDLILSVASKLFLEGPALGLSGPSQIWKGLTPIDVSDKFGFFVHREYRNSFHKIAVNHWETLPIRQQLCKSWELSQDVATL